MGIADRLAAMGRGAAQSSTAGWVDEVYPKILDALPFDDKTGIPREYAGGSAENQYKQEYRADDQAAAQKYPLNYGAGALAGAAPAAIATGGLGAGGQVVGGSILGALQGAGASENSGKELAKDAIRGGALGGALGAGGNLAGAAVPAAKAAMGKLMQGPPPGGPQLAPATGAPVARLPQRPQLGGPQINKMVPPRPTTADLSEVMPEPAEVRLRRASSRGDSPSVPPPDYKTTAVPKQNNMTTRKTTLVDKTGESAEAVVPERIKSTEQTAASTSKTMRPGKGAVKRQPPKPAPEPRVLDEQTALARVGKQAPATRPELTAANKPLVGPKQLSDDRILELARQTNPEPRAPQGAKGLTPEQLEQGKQALRDEFKKTSGGGNVVSLEDGAIQAADDPFIAGTVREYQKHAKAAEAAGDPDQAAWFREKIEDLLSSAGDDAGKAQAR